MSKLIPAAASLATALLLSQTLPAPDPFLEKPYLQMGDAPKLSASESLVLIWHTENVPAKWDVKFVLGTDGLL